MNLLSIFNKDAKTQSYKAQKAPYFFILSAFTILGATLSYFVSLAATIILLNSFNAPLWLAYPLAFFFELGKAYTAHDLFKGWFYKSNLDLLAIIFFCCFWGLAFYSGFHVSHDTHVSEIINDTAATTTAPPLLPTIAPASISKFKAPKTRGERKAQEAQKKAEAEAQKAATAAAQLAVAAIKADSAKAAQRAAEKEKIQKLKAEQAQKSPYKFLLFDLLILVCVIGITHIQNWQPKDRPQEAEEESEELTEAQAQRRLNAARSKGDTANIEKYEEIIILNGWKMPKQRKQQGSTSPSQRTQNP